MFSPLKSLASILLSYSDVIEKELKKLDEDEIIVEGDIILTPEQYDQVKHANLHTR